MSFLTQKNVLEKKQNSYDPGMKNPIYLAPRYKTRIAQKKKWSISDDFGLRSPVIQKTFARKRYTLIQFTTVLG